MAPHVERFPAKQNGVGSEFLGNLSRVQSRKLLAVFPVKQFGVFRLQKPARRSKGHVSFSPIEPRHSLADGYRVRMPRTLGKIRGSNHTFALLSPMRFYQESSG